MKTVSVIARYLLGLIFTVFGLNGFLNFIHQPPRRIHWQSSRPHPFKGVFARISTLSTCGETANRGSGSPNEPHRLARLNHDRKENHMSQAVSTIKQQKSVAGVARVDTKFEVALIPVSDVDRSKDFYTRLGWRLDDDLVMGDDFRVVQFTPPGSASSISFGKGVTTAAPGSFRGGLIVSNIESAHKELAARGIN